MHAQSRLSRPEDNFQTGMKVVFRSGWSLCYMLIKVKDARTVEKLSKVVHWVPCSCGKANIGETVRRLETRIKEHRDAC